ncbi:MAG: zinc ribbon domain-containing protein [Humidesulfovibrio sp.]|uniref:FmdB family zinc ribbon protein n=1 Tax=Humidesulfovibrio sp. TaxID=2910988 RepID=UPI0027330C79|nr:zinc ribbon domain-containing protein [Humidesulfovibrio sp.]MDP2846690.1 zinc ribbon domain-containing protein [Humidesulfovibrio sp.]
MPIFEYVCKKCKNQFEELVFSQDEQAVCPSCGSTRTEKLMSCCRSKVGGGPNMDSPAAQASPAPSGGGCSGCSGGSCSTCH